jgi:polyferredoxin
MGVAATRTDAGPRRRYRSNRRPRIQKWRLTIQIGFALLCIWIGVEFYFFVEHLETAGQAGSSYRPPGVEGFLPISSLMSLYYLILSGNVHMYHPAGLFILGAIILMSLAFGKAFCSWLCPVGFISERLGDLGEKVLGRRLTPPKWLDWPLRMLKYLLLGFFVYSIFFLMGELALKRFLDTPYNFLADVKMYYFFADISRLALTVIGALMLLSIVIRGFWCRYLCPYGALLGLVGLLSPNKIRRDANSCIDCGKCARACPSRIKVDRAGTVFSDECTSCLSCVDSCPVADTLSLQTPVRRRTIQPRAVAVGVVVIFMAVTGLGMLTGYWHNDVPMTTYRQHYPNLHLLGHPTSTSDVSALNEPDATIESAVEAPDNK